MVIMLPRIWQRRGVANSPCRQKGHVSRITCLSTPLLASFTAHRLRLSSRTSHITLRLTPSFRPAITAEQQHAGANQRQSLFRGVCGVVEDAQVAMSGKAKEMAAVISSGKGAQATRRRNREKKEREEEEEKKK